MASSVTFGRPVSRLLQPGGYTQVDASALDLAQDFAPNVVCCIGAALGGEPMKVYAFNSPSQAQQVYGVGSPLGDAIALAFRGGVKGGAPLVLGVRADNAAQASGVLTNNGTTVLGTFKDFGGYGNTYSVQFLPGSIQGTQAVVSGTFINGTPYRQTIDNEPSFSNLLARLTAESPVNVVATAGGVKATQTLTLATSTADGSATLTTNDATELSTAGFFYQYPASLLANTTNSLVVSYAGSNPVGTPTTIAISSALPASVEGTYNVVRKVDSYNLALTNVGVTLTAYGSNIYRFTLTGANVWQHATGAGLIGSTFTITGGAIAGTYQVLHHEWDGTGVDKVRTVQKLDTGAIAAGTVASVTFAFRPSIVLDPTSQPATEALETQLPASGILARGGQYLSVSLDVPGNPAGALAVFYSTLPGDTIQGVGIELARLINESSDWAPYAIAAATYNGGTFTSTITLTAVPPGVVGNGWKPNILVNTQTTVLVARGGTVLTGGIDPLPPTGSILLTSGFDSVPTLQRWLQALEAVKYTPLRYLVPAGTADAGVQAAFADHCRLMSTTAQRRERLCILGHGLGWTKQQINARAETFNSERVVFVSPGLQMADLLTGNQRTYSSAYATTAIVAGMLAAEGNGVSDPITHTFLANITDVEFQYQSGSLELDNAIISGVLTIERDPTLVRESRGYRVTRGITTARSSVVFEQISIINQSDYVAQTIRDMEETLYIGRALDGATLSLLRESINLSLDRLSSQGIIYGFDPGFTLVSLNKANRSAIDCTYKIYPAPAIDWILNSQLLFPIPDAQSLS
jgi:hypothetical protein